MNRGLFAVFLLVVFACSTVQPAENNVAATPAPAAKPKNDAENAPAKAKSDDAIIKPDTSATENDESEQASSPPLKWTDVAAQSGTTLSFGGPNYGELRGHIRLPEKGTGFRHNPKRPENAVFGSAELVAALLRAAEKVDIQFPGSEITIGDLSLEDGGPIDGHGSHQNGRDVDVLFYIFDKAGKPMPGVGAPLDEKGRGVDFKDLKKRDDDVPVRLDVRRSWYFVEAMLEDESPARVARIFLAEHIRSLLLSYAEKEKRPEKIRNLFADMTCQPSHPHDDHFHFRFFCTPEDIALGCEDTRPIYPWHRRYLRKAGAELVIADRKKKKKSKITTLKEARAESKKKEDEFHPDVVRWLKKRDAWTTPPKTGRKFCR